jgi:hypothetical protein
MAKVAVTLKINGETKELLIKGRCPAYRCAP